MRDSGGNIAKKLDFRANTAELVILITGAIIRLIYVLGSTIYERQYDIGQISLDAGHTVSGGHLAYIQYLYENLHLPDVDPTTVYQFHHPPVHHYICALWMKFLSLFIHNNAILEESIQVVPFAFSLITLYFLYRILKEFEVKGYMMCISLVIFAFHPALILLSGSVNNDCTAMAFTVMTIYYFLRWIKDHSYKNIILTALFLGLGISTKQNVAELAFPMAVCFVIELFKAVLKKQLVLQYICFGAISIPLGMWFYIRNLIKYNMSILWVYELPKDSWQYTGNVPVINRFLWPVPAEMIDNLKHFRIGCGYNVWMQIMRTSVLGEWDMASAGKGIKVLAVFLMLLGALIAVVAFASLFGFIETYFIKSDVKNDESGIKSDDKSSVKDDDEISVKNDGELGVNEGSKIQALFIIISYLTTMIFYLVFVYKYPQECSMNFRYITITLLFTVLSLGKWGFIERNEKVKSGFSVLLLGFILFSVLMTGVWIKG